jgi:hypothetical protein
MLSQDAAGKQHVRTVSVSAIMMERISSFSLKRFYVLRDVYMQAIYRIMAPVTLIRIAVLDARMPIRNASRGMSSGDFP